MDCVSVKGLTLIQMLGLSDLSDVTLSMEYCAGKVRIRLSKVNKYINVERLLNPNRKKNLIGIEL